MKILDLIHFVDALVPFDYYPNKFPTDSIYVADFIAVITMTGGFPVTELGTERPSFQIRVRGGKNGGADIAACEAKAYEIHDALTNLREQTIGTDRVIEIRAQESAPRYIGDDQNGRPIYSMNFSTTVRPGA